MTSKTPTAQKSDEVEEGATGTPDPVQESSSGAGACSKVEEWIPTNWIDAAHEFRMDCKVSARAYAHCFFCRICGSPAGNDTYYCKTCTHSICKLCAQELQLWKCPLPLKYKDKVLICDGALMKGKSVFRKFIYDNTKVSCANKERGCDVEGVWEDVCEHQKKCEKMPAPERESDEGAAV